MIKFQGSNAQHDGYSLQCCVVYVKFVKRMNLRYSHYTQKVTVWGYLWCDWCVN